MNFRGPVKMLSVFVLNRKRQPNQPPVVSHGWIVRDNSMPQRDWRKYDASPLTRNKASRATLILRRALKAKPLPELLRRQA